MKAHNGRIRVLIASTLSKTLELPAQADPWPRLTRHRNIIHFPSKDTPTRRTARSRVATRNATSRNFLAFYSPIDRFYSPIDTRIHPNYIGSVRRGLGEFFVRRVKYSSPLRRILFPYTHDFLEIWHAEVFEVANYEYEVESWRFLIFKTNVI